MRSQRLQNNLVVMLMTFIHPGKITLPITSPNTGIRTVSLFRHTSLSQQGFVEPDDQVLNMNRQFLEDPGP